MRHPRDYGAIVLLAHPNPKLRALVAGGVQEYAELARQAEASHLALEFSDADISSYAPAKVRQQLHFRSFFG